MYYVFDLIYLDGYDLSALPLLQRKNLLSALIPNNPLLKFSSHIESQGEAFFKIAIAKGLEGIIAKKIQSAYTKGKRSKDWLKIKSVSRQEAVIAGYTEPLKSREYFGSLILGVYKNGRLFYIGNCGTGFTHKILEEIFHQLKNMETNKCPFTTVPAIKGNPHWVKPKLVCEVKFLEWTEEGIMRQPSFIGIREDKRPEELINEEKELIVKEVSERPKKKGNSFLIKNENIANKNIVVENRKLELTHLNKIFWSELGYTKADLINYYDQISDYLLPFLINRPQVLHRNPNGVEDAGFYQKDNHDLPSWIESVEIASESAGKKINYALCNDKASLLYFVNLGCVEFNPWLSRINSLEFPDFAVIDLDPLNVPFNAVIEVANTVKQVLDNLNIKGYCKTSGKKGIHILIPLGAKYTYDQSRNFAEIIATLVKEKLPQLTSLERMPSQRQKKVYLDCLQNRFGQTIAAPYSLRPVPLATISTPLEWEELKKELSPENFTMDTIFQRLKKKGDLFKELLNYEGVILEDILKQKK